VEDPGAITKIFKILIAEDNPINMLLTETILINCLPNVTIIQAENGLQAVEACTREVPDLIFMDVQMPVLNGYEATQQIRRIPGCEAIPIVALTAGNVKGEKEKCLAVGMDDFVVKPIVEETLRQVLNKWLEFEEEDNEGAKDPMKGNSMHFDSEKLKVYADGNVDFLQKIFLIVKDELNGSSRDLEIKRESQDFKGLKEAAHKLYGTSASSGFEILAALTRELETSESWDEAVTSDLIEKILREIQTVLNLLDET
jgi:CheY-like chemotaxis protein